MGRGPFRSSAPPGNRQSLGRLGFPKRPRAQRFQALGNDEGLFFTYAADDATGFFFGAFRLSSTVGGAITIFLAGAFGFLGSRPVRFWLFAISVS